MLVILYLFHIELSHREKRLTAKPKTTYRFVIALSYIKTIEALKEQLKLSSFKHSIKLNFHWGVIRAKNPVSLNEWGDVLRIQAKMIAKNQSELTFEIEPGLKSVYLRFRDFQAYQLSVFEIVAKLRRDTQINGHSKNVFKLRT